MIGTNKSYLILIILLSSLLVGCTDSAKNTDQLIILTGQLDDANQKREASFEQFYTSLPLVWDFAFENYDTTAEASEAVFNNQAELELMKAEIAKINVANKDSTNALNAIK